MKPVSREHAEFMQRNHKATGLELWRDAMCAMMPMSDKGECITPDGIREFTGLPSTCRGCRYSNYKDKEA